MTPINKLLDMIMFQRSVDYVWLYGFANYNAKIN